MKISRNLVLKVKAHAALAELEEHTGSAEKKVKTEVCKTCPKLNSKRAWGGNFVSPSHMQ